MIRSFNGKTPKIHKTAFVHPAAEVIGDVTLGPRASVWPGAVLRGDVDKISVGANTNIQDNTVVHCRRGRPCVIGKSVVVGHSVVLHGTFVKDKCLIGMGSVVMETTLGKESLVAAGAVVLAGLKVPPRSLVLGSPAKVRRTLKPSEVEKWIIGEKEYLEMSKLHRETSRVVG